MIEGQQASRGARVPRQPAAARVLDGVRRILVEVCEQDGQASMPEPQRRKAYRAGINRALAEIARAK